MLRTANKQPGSFSKRIRTALPAVLLLAGQAMNAQAESGAYEMVVYENSSQGKRLIRGQFDSEFPKGSNSAYKQFDQANNHCVMLTMTRRFDEARQACDSAVAMTATTQAAFGSPESERTDRAIALTNRGVLNALTGDFSQATADFEEALTLSKRVKAAKGNLYRVTTAPLLTAALVQ